MKKAKIFFITKWSEDKFEANVNEWLAQNPNIKIVSTAGTNQHYVIIYEE